jgi:hypothetical protein
VQRAVSLPPRSPRDRLIGVADYPSPANVVPVASARGRGPALQDVRRTRASYERTWEAALAAIQRGDGAQARASLVRAWTLGAALGEVMRANGRAPARDDAGARNDLVALMRLTMGAMPKAVLQPLHEVLNPEPPQPHEQLDVAAMTGLRKALAYLCPYGAAIWAAKNTSVQAIQVFDTIDASELTLVEKHKAYKHVCESLFALMNSLSDRQPGAVDEPEVVRHINAAITRAGSGPAA